jgi:hypothetical protein
MAARLCSKCELLYPDEAEWKHCIVCERKTQVKTGAKLEKGWKYAIHNAMSERRDAKGEWAEPDEKTLRLMEAAEEQFRQTRELESALKKTTEEAA